MVARRVRRVGLVAVIVMALVVGLLVGWLLPRSEPASVGDHRAYLADSGEITVEEGLRRAEIVLPGCVGDEDLRYAWVSPGGYGFYLDGYLMFRTSEECMNTFLSANAMTIAVTDATRLGGPEEAVPLQFGRPPWSEEMVTELGWEVGPEQRFQEFGVTTPNSYRMTALVQYLPDSSDVRAYLYTYRAG